MNTIRNIEGATIITISALCVAAVLSIAVQTGLHALPCTQKCKRRNSHTRDAR